MLGEIIKSTEALRFHAKSAEIAGQNLAHVNDESYARQRVLAREGLMHKGQGGLIPLRSMLVVSSMLEMNY